MKPRACRTAALCDRSHLTDRDTNHKGCFTITPEPRIFWKPAKAAAQSPLNPSGANTAIDVVSS